MVRRWETARSRRARRPAWAGLAALLLAAGPGHADERDVPHFEPGLLPAHGYTPDTGADLGVFAHLARFEPGRRPYAYRLRAQLQASLTVEDGTPEVRKLDNYLRADLPGFPGDADRLYLEGAWQRIHNFGYFGIGAGAIATYLTADQDF